MTEKLKTAVIGVGHLGREHARIYAALEAADLVAVCDTNEVTGREIAAQDGVKFVLGAYSSALTKAMAPVTEKYKVPHIEANGAARELFTEGYKYLFAVLSTSDYYLRDAVYWNGELEHDE